MTLAIVYARAAVGMQAPLVTVEVHLAKGMPQLNIVGLPAAAVKESKYRVRSAILNAGFEFPRRRLTINLAPADLPKEGGRFDLGIAIGILAASGQIKNDHLSNYEFIGELALSGELRPIRGSLPVVLAAEASGRTLILPEENADEAGLVAGTRVKLAKHLLEVCAYLKGSKTLLSPPVPNGSVPETCSLDLADVSGQLHAKRALEIAAAGKHSILLVGPPGTGKTMLAARLITLLPEMTDQQALESAAIASISQQGFEIEKWRRLPFRAPHHSSSAAALVGGGRPPRPGEISLAHHGVLFLDELPEFDRAVLECLREPLESGHVTISRATYQTTFPAEFQLVAAMNPCPCGHAGSPTVECRCSDDQVRRYWAKLSGPLLDRIDMHIEVSSLPHGFFTIIVDKQERSVVVKNRALQARMRQHARQKKCNQDLMPQELLQYACLTEEALVLINKMMETFHFSLRSYHRIIKVARTIADLYDSASLLAEHISEAFTYRALNSSKFEHKN